MEELLVLQLEEEYKNRISLKNSAIDNNLIKSSRPKRCVKISDIAVSDILKCDK